MKIIDIVYVHLLKHKTDVQWHQRYHCHENNQYELHYFIEGKGALLIDKTPHTFSKHDIFLISPNTQHAVQSKNYLLFPVSYYAILFQLEDIDDDVKKFIDDENFLKQFPYKVPSHQHSFFSELLNKKMQKNNPFLHKVAQHKLYSFLYELFSEKIYVKNETNKKQENNFFIDKTVNYMHKNIHENIAIATIALHLGITVEYLIRLFKKHMRTTPYNYYIDIKIEESCALLTNTNMSIKNISSLLRFSYQQNFTRTFTQKIGMSPSAYRNTYIETSGITTSDT